MDYSTAIKYLESSGKNSIRLGLERIKALLFALGNPERRLKVIHIAGTNGKGSLCAMLGSILTEAGYLTGVYTSPHLVRYNERFRLGREEISDLELADELTGLKEVCDGLFSAEDYPTAFELLTAAAFDLFAKKGVDFAVMETGLGGRFDATNAIEAPLLSVITRVGMDHMDYLGDSLEGIALEKAGIIKNLRPLILCENSRTVYNAVRRVCGARSSRLYYSKGVEIEAAEESLLGQTLSVKGELYEYKDLFLPLAGEFQKENLAGALLAVRALQELGAAKISESALREGLKRVEHPGRMEFLAGLRPQLILDGAHNLDGAKTLALSLERLLPGRDITLLTGVLADKSFKEIMSCLLPLVKRVVVTEPLSPRALGVSELGAVVEALGIKPYLEPDAGRALELARELTPADGIIVSSGSLYLIGELKRILKNEG